MDDIFAETDALGKRLEQILLWRGYEQGNILIRQDRKPHQEKALEFLKKKYPSIDGFALTLAFVMGWDACEHQREL